ncbi:hypothetical protein FA15DRAFT_758717 [Coprinopsis marcescibilis]|uniref:Uncharacterized protein n=1 Tax=Coprinopsis marcescibilis TaxID=230819 RepID=A0A5C3KMB7_COPMA|nr:hypothetical protein FA15DRAFT_758717 [Coprinopsis marcescibilis]
MFQTPHNTAFLNCGIPSGSAVPFINGARHRRAGGDESYPYRQFNGAPPLHYPGGTRSGVLINEGKVDPTATLVSGTVVKQNSQLGRSGTARQTLVNVSGPDPSYAYIGAYNASTGRVRDSATVAGGDYHQNNSYNGTRFPRETGVLPLASAHRAHTADVASLRSSARGLDVGAWNVGVVKDDAVMVAGDIYIDSNFMNMPQAHEGDLSCLASQARLPHAASRTAEGHTCRVFNLGTISGDAKVAGGTINIGQSINYVVSPS